jgi:hypothetical protein
LSTQLPEELTLSKGREIFISSSGILPISQSGFDGVMGKESKNADFGKKQADFSLVGSGEALVGCGTFFTVGCLNVEEHTGMNLDGVNMEGKAYLERHKRTCHRPLCPTCWPDWANREAEKAAQRLDAFVLKGRNLKPIHLTVSIPHSDYDFEIEALRKKSYAALKRVHCLGGMMIYHPKRQNKYTKAWYFSPHFHIVGYGWIVDVRQNYISSGYVVKNIGIRKTVHGTIWYQLSHCGLDGKHHAVTWFGCLAYGKLHVEYKEADKSECPLCHNELHQVLWIGLGPPDIPEIEGFAFYDDVENWMEKPSRFMYGE